MRNNFAILFLLFFSASAASSDTLTNPAALAKLQLSTPGVRWELTSSLRIDINSDGAPDYVFLSQSAHEAKVGVVISRMPSVYVQSIPIADPAQDSICAAPASIGIESLDYEPPADAPGFVESKTGTSFGLGGGECDVFHFYWNAKSHKMSWWRL